MNEVINFINKFLGIPLLTDVLEGPLSDILDKMNMKNVDILFITTGEILSDAELIDMDYIGDSPGIEASLSPPSPDKSDAGEDLVEADFMIDDPPESDLISSPLEFTVIINLEVLQDVKIKLPGLEGIFFVLNPENFDLNICFSNYYFKKFGTTIGFALGFSQEYLKPMKKMANAEGEAVYEFDEEKECVIVQIASATFSVDSDGKFDFEGELGIQIEDPVMIGDTGAIIENIDMVLNLSGEGPRPAGTPEGWKGLMIKSAKLSVPDVFTGSIDIEGLGIGSGGVSGTISGNFPISYNQTNGTLNGQFVGEVFGMHGGLESIGLTLQENRPSGGSLKMKLLLPFFEGMDKPLDLDVSITEKGFTAEVSSENGIIILEKEDIIKVSVDSIGFGYEDRTWAATIAGKIKPLFGGMDWPEVDIKALTIDSEGNVKVDGGWIEVPKQLAMDFNGFKLELTKIGFGKEEDGWNWVGLSGGINIVEGIPLKGGVDGLKIKWKGNDFGLEISGISVLFEIEEVLRFDGKVFFIDEPDVKGFKGGILMVLCPLDGMMIDAQFIAGKHSNPDFNFFYIFIGLELPIGIPLGATGAALYGMAGLFGYNMSVNKRDNEAWFEDEQGNAGFYKREPVGITSVEKWNYAQNALAFGAGITLGTAYDNGFTFSGKVLLVILIPGPVILVEGKASFLKERGSISEEPIFRMLAVLDCRVGTFLMNIEAQYKYPEGGEVVSVGGVAEAFFNFNNPRDWHFYIGMNSPESKRIRAQILSLFTANFYFMIDSRMFEMGSWVGYKKQWKFGPFGVKLEAWMEGILGMSFEPIQAWGSLTINGDIQLKVCGFGFGLSAFAMLAATTPNPWWIRGDLEVKLNLPWPLPDPEIDIKLEWKEDKTPPFTNPIAGFGIEHLKVSEKWELDLAAIKEDSPIVPLDARPVINFAKAVEDSVLIGDVQAAAPSPERIDKYQFKYCLKKVSLEKMAKTPNSTWITVAEKSTGDPTADSILHGEWQLVPGEPANTKLMLWANTPFDICRELESNTNALISIMGDKLGYPCEVDITPKWIRVDFEKLTTGSEYLPILLNEFLFYTEIKPMLIEYCPNWAGTKNVLAFDKEFMKICIGIDTLDEVKTVKLNHNGVEFEAIDASDYEDFIYVLDDYPSPPDGINEIWFGRVKYIKPFQLIGKITFSEDKFLDGVSNIIIPCVRRGDALFRAFNKNDELISEIKHIGTINSLEVLSLPGQGIHHVDVFGSWVGILDLCYEISFKKNIDPHLLISFSEDMARTELFMTQGSYGTITTLDSYGATLGDFEFDNNVPDNEMKPVLMKDSEKWIRALKISGKFKIARINSLTKTEEHRVGNNMIIIQHMKEAVEERWGIHTGAVLESYHYYRLTVDAEVSRKKDGGDWSEHIYTKSVYFQTEGPPGIIPANRVFKSSSSFAGIDRRIEEYLVPVESEIVITDNIP